MTELAHYKQGYGRLPGFGAGSSIFVITTALMSAGINLWLHNLWMAGLNLFTAVGFLPTLFVQGIIYLNVRWSAQRFGFKMRRCMRSRPPISAYP